MVSIAARAPLPAQEAPLPRHRFTALVVAASAGRRNQLCTRLRSLGARDVVEAASCGEARVRANASECRDLLVVETGLPDGPSLPLIGELRAAGWRRVVLLTTRDDPYAVRAALAASIRGYVLTSDPAPFAVPTRRAATRVIGLGDDLSGREVQVLVLVADGNSNRSIGDALGLSALTVKSHLARIARKLGTGDRAEMVAMAMRSGLVS